MLTVTPLSRPPTLSFTLVRREAEAEAFEQIKRAEATKQAMLAEADGYAPRVKLKLPLRLQSLPLRLKVWKRRLKPWPR